MDGHSEKTLVVETGILCNNRCVFCYENGYRRIPDYVKLMPTAEIFEKVDWGAANGFNSLSLTGGEPTIRKDFVDIVRHARMVGYGHVSVTTNGSRLGDGKFFSECVRAGLDGMGVSIHGMSSAMHDSLTGRTGSFASAVKAVRNGVRAVEALGGRRFRLNTFTVIHRGNVGNLWELTDMLSALGVRLMILQPPVTGKANVTPVASVPLADVIKAVSDAARAGSRNGYLVKPFNIPPCMLVDVAGGLDLTMYTRSSFREQDDVVPGGRSRGEEVGFVRLSVCPECRYRDFCNGLSLTLAPDADLANAMIRAVGARPVGAGRDKPLWLTGTELLGADGLRDVVGAAGGGRVWICTGGTHRLGADLPAAVAGCGADAGLAFVHQARDPGSADRILCSSDNTGYLTDAFRALVESGIALPVAVCGAPEASFLAVLEALHAEGLARFGAEIRLSMPWRSLDGGEGFIREIAAFSRDRLNSPRPVILSVDRIHESELGSLGSLLDRLGSISDVEMDLSMDVPATPFENQIWSILNWSVMKNFRRQEGDLPGIEMDSVQVRPFI